VPKASSPTHDYPDKPKRDKHGQNRGLPPPATFDFEGLPDGSPLSEFEVAAILRVSTNTVGSWRRQPDHPLQWFALPNGFIRYTVAAIRAYLASGEPRPRGKPPATKAGAAPAPKRTPPAKPARRRRAPARPRAAPTPEARGGAA
jgi:hypothetical protein